jgi:peroxiredoxin Q/BCP
MPLPAVLLNKFVDANALVLGVSKDSLESHQKFCEKQKIPFPLVSDQDGKLCKIFNVLTEKTIFGKKLFDMIDRSTFVFDKQHVLVKEWRKVNAAGHALEVLSFVSQIDIYN